MVKRKPVPQQTDNAPSTSQSTLPQSEGQWGSGEALNGDVRNQWGGGDGAGEERWEAAGKGDNTPEPLRAGPPPPPPGYPAHTEASDSTNPYIRMQQTGEAAVSNGDRVVNPWEGGGEDGLKEPPMAASPPMPKGQ